VVCGALALCSGCFDLVQEIWLEAGGGGRLRLEISVPKSLLSMGRLGGEDLLLSTREDAANAKAELARDPDIRRFDYRAVEEGGVFKLIYEVEANDASKLPAAQARALSVLARKAGRGGSGARQAPVDFTVERRFGLGMDFTGVLAGGAGEKDTVDREEPGAELGKAMAEAMLGGPLGHRPAARAGHPLHQRDDGRHPEHGGVEGAAQRAGAARVPPGDDRAGAGGGLEGGGCPRRGRPGTGGYRARAPHVAAAVTARAGRMEAGWRARTTC